MSRIRILIEDGGVVGAYSDDPNDEVIVYDFDWNGEPENLDTMREHTELLTTNLEKVIPVFISPFDFE